MHSPVQEIGVLRSSLSPVASRIDSPYEKITIGKIDPTTLNSSDFLLNYSVFPPSHSCLAGALASFEVIKDVPWLLVDIKFDSYVSGHNESKVDVVFEEFEPSDVEELNKGSKAYGDSDSVIGKACSEEESRDVSADSNICWDDDYEI